MRSIRTKYNGQLRSDEILIYWASVSALSCLASLSYRVALEFCVLLEQSFVIPATKPTASAKHRSNQLTESVNEAMTYILWTIVIHTVHCYQQLIMNKTTTLLDHGRLKVQPHFWNVFSHVLLLQCHGTQSIPQLFHSLTTDFQHQMIMLNLC